MINVSNLCSFEGRIVKDPQISQQGQGQNTYTKVLFTIAVDRKLTKEQREAKKNGTDVLSSDFIPMVANGSLADVIAKYFCKGKPIKIIASYQSYQSKDAQGNTKYGHIFKVEDLGFVLKDSTDQNQNGNNSNNGNNNNGNNGNNGNNNYQQPNNNNNNGGGQNNYQQQNNNNNYQQQNNNNQGNNNNNGGYNPNGDVIIDDMDIPF